MNKRKIDAIFSRLKKANPKPTTELVYRNPFELLIAVILSAQATDKSVNKATQHLFEVAKTPTEMYELGETKLKSYIRTIGLFSTKAKNIILTSNLLVEKYHSKVPKNREDLESLPGVGRKTANVILNTCFGEPVIAVDTHIFRVANRLGLVKAKTPLECEKQLMRVVPDQYKQDAHHWLILHGRYICTARKPGCPECLLRDLCEYPHKTQGECNVH